jgi:hypothetical protein
MNKGLQKMVQYLWSSKVLYALLSAFLLTIYIVIVARVNHPNLSTRELRVEYLKSPASMTLSTIALVLPVIAGLASYVLNKGIHSDLSFLAAAILLFLASFVVAFWEAFGLMKKLGTSETVQLVFPKDRGFITGLGLMYLYFLLGVFSLVAFLLFGLKLN